MKRSTARVGQKRLAKKDEGTKNPLLKRKVAGRSASVGSPQFGVYSGSVIDIRDPEALGRVKVMLSGTPESKRSALWARVATMMAGKNRGTRFIPDVNDEVLIAFEGGDARRPYVLGALWNGQDTPPEAMDAGGNNVKKVIRSRNDVKVTMNDQNDQEKLILETPGGQRIMLKDGPGSIEVADSNGNSAKLDASGITVMSSGTLTINAGAAVEIFAGSVLVNAGLCKLSGVMQCDTVICNSVVSASYSPGAGNVW